MIEQMMQHDGTLRMVTAAPGERCHLQVQLRDQPVTMRRDNVHVGRVTVRPVEKRLRRSSETVAILLVPREPERRSSAPRGDCPTPRTKKGGPLRDRPKSFDAAWA